MRINILSRTSYNASMAKEFSSLPLKLVDWFDLAQYVDINLKIYSWIRSRIRDKSSAAATTELLLDHYDLVDH